MSCLSCRYRLQLVAPRHPHHSDFPLDHRWNWHSMWLLSLIHESFCSSTLYGRVATSFTLFVVHQCFQTYFLCLQLQAQHLLLLINTTYPACLVMGFRCVSYPIAFLDSCHSPLAVSDTLLLSQFLGSSLDCLQTFGSLCYLFVKCLIPQEHSVGWSKHSWMPL